MKTLNFLNESKEEMNEDIIIFSLSHNLVGEAKTKQPMVQPMLAQI
jgi:hypothetical protein